ncbi:MAG: DUF6183 family protein [Kofleriaceae bacterium]
MSVETALQLISTIRSLPRPTNGHPNGHERTYGRRLTASESVDTFHEVLAIRGAEPELLELFACWLQEFVLRGDRVGGPDVDALVERLVIAKHPFAQLPLYLLPIERAEPLPLDDWEWQHMPTKIDMHDAIAIEPHPQLRSLHDDGQLFAWEFEARAFTLDPPMQRPPDSELLRALDLQSIVGSAIPEQVAPHLALSTRGPITLHVAAATFEQVLRTMTFYARKGNAWEGFPSNAYARCYVWRTLAAFAGLSRDASIHDVAAIGERAFWSLFLADNTWFARFGWDYAVAGISPDGVTLNVIAGTDRDDV